MDSLKLAIVATGISVGLWYSLGMIRLIRKKGLDPSLLTYLTPLSLYKFWLARLLMLATLVTELYNHPLALLYAAFIFGFALTHIVLLIAFNRTASQPTAYYLVLMISVSVLVFNLSMQTLVIFLAVAMVVQEVQLQRWQKARLHYYNHWVAGEVKRIHQTYRHVAADISDREWFYVLHFAVTESIARPKLSRWLEYLYFYIRRPARISTGIMQVQADRPLSDLESIRRGLEIICNALRDMPPHLIEQIDQLKWLADTYNGASGINTAYTTYLLATYPGLLLAWQDIKLKS